MGILPKPNEKEAALAKRKSQPDFTHLGPLKPGGAAGFVHFRDRPRRMSKKSGRGSGSDSDMETDDDGGPSILDTVEANERRDSGLSPDDGQSGELAEGVRQIKVGTYWSMELGAWSMEQDTDWHSLNDSTPQSPYPPAARTRRRRARGQPPPHPPRPGLRPPRRRRCRQQLRRIKMSKADRRRTASLRPRLAAERRPTQAILSVVRSRSSGRVFQARLKRR